MTPFSAERPPGPDILWEPDDRRKQQAHLTRYLAWLRDRRNRTFGSYDDLWRWSVTDLAEFWSSVWEFVGVRASRPFESVLSERRVFGARWFSGAHLNYAEHALSRQDDHPAILFKSEDAPLRSLSHAELYRQTAAAAAALRAMGVRRGDRVAAYMPNIPETIIAFLATASIGAIWSSCSPEFGVRSVVERFQQIEPRLLLAVGGYRYHGRMFDRSAELAAIERALPSLRATVVVPSAGSPGVRAAGDNRVSWPDAMSATPVPELTFEQVPFDHPLWVLFSSGTTGLPKAIVHGHGGILVETMKLLALHMDVGSDDRFFWFTTTGWMMWNFLVCALLVGATLVLYDGSPVYPDVAALWRLADEAKTTYFGTSPAYLGACVKAGIRPGRFVGLDSLRTIGSTGSSLSADGFRWVYEHVKSDVLLGSTSGGTDVCTAFVTSCPMLPVVAGEIQCRALGAKVEAFDAGGSPVTDAVGELVVTEPLPSMPLYFWDDPDKVRYRASYFDKYPGVWRHGDWITITSRHTCVVHGRSDATLNRGGIRMGTSEFYGVVEALPEVLDSLVVDAGESGRDGGLLLFVVLRDNATLDPALEQRIRAALRRELSPRHVPDKIYAIAEVPRTLSGKKLEVPVKRILSGTPVEEAVSIDSTSNAGSLRFFTQLASATGSRGGSAG